VHIRVPGIMAMGVSCRTRPAGISLPCGVLVNDYGVGATVTQVIVKVLASAVKDFSGLVTMPNRLRVICPTHAHPP